MLNLASAASTETKELVKQVLEVSEGKRKLQTVDEVQTIQKKIKAQAAKAQEKGKLSKKQVESLVEASRGHISTGFGTCHEDEALDVYEKQMGCSVRERNEALMEWRFMRIMDVDSDLGVTALPMGEAKRRVWERLDAQVLDDDKREGPQEVKQADETKSEPIEIDDDGDDNVENDVAGNADSSSKTNESEAENCAGLASSMTPVSSTPFFRIVGAVDGVRDELYMDSSRSPAPRTEASVPPNNSTSTASAESAGTLKNVSNEQNDNTSEFNFSNDEEDQWSLRPIIVECKHRMREAKVPPPLYDQIQTCLYCHMYNVEEADLIQVVRRKREGKEKENEAPDSNEADGKSGSTVSTKEDIKITTTRVSLNDPIHNHNHHWRATLLPRIASFVDAVYSVRKDDGKRYRLLMAFVQSQQEESENGSEDETWKLL
eukprot:CAMPEP_0172569240 /NCGR_PEP_ID=MMETSP1067-20121228/122747_1 /TAXON_ID=265564 ORGANISM="Thalassiosira punctigera, Strain Tpunct2005C2" /NCGR_SAMPLE_ID=MMETSP1067 /ASSEMBLY_ACC=CAM_ASM_000444 /LENGTH=431 /DNA_ID=CAMNT_0013361023 /DNA_START=16 /DNA_END=1308 /DNA_ORIENTATION=+